MTRRRVFYGWWIVAACFCLQFTFVSNPLSIILKTLMYDFDTGRGMVSLVQTVFFISGGISSVFVGKYIQRWGPKKFLLYGSLVGVVSIFLSSMADSVWFLYVTYLFYGAGMFGMAGPVTLVNLTSRWFVKKRGLALGLVFAGMALGQLVIIPVIGWIAENLGWQATYITSGLLVLCINLPIILLVVKDSPEKMGLLPDGVEGTGVAAVTEKISAGTTRATAVPARGLSQFFHCLPFWLISFGFPLIAIAESGIGAHEVAFITDMGISTTLAASAFGFTGAISGIGRIASGWLVDRISPRNVIFMLLGLGMVGVLILTQAESMGLVWLFVVIYGIGHGTVGVMLALVVADVFGNENMSVVFGFANMIYMLGMACGSPLAGFIYDFTGSYMTEFVIVVVFYAVTILAVYLAYADKGRRLKKQIA